MITIPTGELCGLLGDVVPFASTDEDLPALCSVQLEWDGQVLHAMATDRFRLGWSRWDPDDDPQDNRQDDLFTQWGGDDRPWRVLVPAGDAKDVVRNFKLPAKERGTPVTVEAVDGLGRHEREPEGGNVPMALRVARRRDTGHSAITMVVRGQPTAAGDVPDVRRVLADADVLVPTMGVAYSARWLADFARVRPYGPLEMRFCRGLTRVQIGERFDGAIVPQQLGDEVKGDGPAGGGSAGEGSGDGAAAG